jgi:hypothetical protein
MSVPCYLYGVLLNKDGVLHIYKDRLEFVTQQHEVVSAGSGGLGQV